MSDTTYILEQTPDDDTFGGRLFRARDAAGISVKELAGRLSVNAKTIRGWESDRSQPSAHRLANLAGLLSVSLSWLLHGVGQAPAEDAPDTSGTEAIAEQLSRLQALHADTGALIIRLQADISRLAVASASPGARA